MFPKLSFALFNENIFENLLVETFIFHIALIKKIEY